MRKIRNGHKEFFKSWSKHSCKIYQQENTSPKKITEIANDQKKPFKLTNNLLDSSNATIFSTHYNREELANTFGIFLTGKISTIQDQLAISKYDLGIDALNTDIKFFGIPLDSCSLATELEVSKLIMNSASKSCELDPIYTNILKLVIDILYNNNQHQTH